MTEAFSEQKEEMGYLENIFGLSGKTAVVGGGAGAIGTVMSDALLRAGAKVVVWSRTQKSIDVFLDKYKNEPERLDRLKGMLVDMSEEAAVSKAVDAVAERFGLPEILINCVGGNIGKTPFVDLDIEQFRKVLDTNLFAGLVIPSRLFCRQWIDEGVKGCIINLASMASYIPLSGTWAYDASKAATLSLTMAMANEFAPYGIRVNAIAPGFFIGKQNKDLLVDKKNR